MVRKEDTLMVRKEDTLMVRKEDTLMVRKEDRTVKLLVYRMKTNIDQYLNFGSQLSDHTSILGES